MSLKLFIFAFLVIGFVSCQDGLFTGFDYSNQGDDWDYTDCVNTTNFVVQNLSPLNLTVNETLKWGYYYYFLPQYASAQATVKQYNITVEFNATSEFGRVYTVTAGKQIGIYQATSIRIHSEAEHVVNNTRYPVELQIYHQLIDSRTPANKYQANLFVSVFFDVATDGSSSELLGNITSAIQNNASTATIDFSTMFNLASTRTEVYSYGGTQTIPPCYPTSWLVFPQVHYASADQINVIHALYHNNTNFNGNGNYRQVQPLHLNNQTYLLNSASDLITSTDL